MALRVFTFRVRTREANGTTGTSDWPVEAANSTSAWRKLISMIPIVLPYVEPINRRI